MMKNQKYSQSLLAISVIGALISFIWGMCLVGDYAHEGWIAGAIMMSAGLGILTSVGLALRSTDSNDRNS